MLTILRVGRTFTGDLPPTLTYAARAWTWAPTVPLDGLLGDLTIELLHAKSGKVESDTYQLSGGDPLPGLMGRRWWLDNTGEDTGDEVYEIVLGGLTRCTCPAGAYRAKEAEPCKHVASLRALLAHGLLDDHDAPGSDAQRSGLAFHDEPGEPTVAELAAH